MLSKILRLVVKKGTSQTDELARCLQVPPPMMEQMLKNLTSFGYLQILAPGCSQPCTSCPLRTMCAYRNQPRIWALTRKGEDFLRQT